MEVKEESVGFFARLKNSISKTKTVITERIDGVFQNFKTIDDDLYDELEEVLIMADIGANTTTFILDELKDRAKKEGVREPEELKTLLKAIISEILESTNNEMNLDGNPAVIVVIGVNGVGKTTSIGKMASMYKAQGKKVILAAADTFRAAAIDQLEIWAERAGVEIVKHREGADPSAVVFDAIAAAKARKADVVICDTAGRLHNKKPLMEELKKVSRVVERESGNDNFESLLVLDGSTGQNALIQAKEFASVSRITGVILTKLDGTAKGGVIIPLAKEQNIGVKFIGIGEKIDDLRPFNPTQFAKALFDEE
ncbi:MAG: signal recognition particle-docking protein FtsY [Clostridia bacterium]|nr:signal recognition particle-docking protein FtsY [Clostridia bacterium]